MTYLNDEISLESFVEVLQKNSQLSISDDVYKRLDKSFQFLDELYKEQLVYGINTGFGPMAQYQIPNDQQIDLQYNLIRSHCTGAGEILDTKTIRAAMIARLSSLTKGYSGINRTVVDLLVQLINQEVYPVIYEHGGVGASGDLVQLSHIALVLIGEGEVIYKDEVQATSAVFEKLGLKPIEIKIREGLALINGTSLMTGLGLSNLIESKSLFNWSVAISSIINEIVSAYSDHLSKELNQIKHHKGQIEVAKQMRELLEGSQLIQSRKLNIKKSEHAKIDKKVQEYYSLRCVPQILGPIADVLSNSETVLINELNSVNDNPIIDPDNNNIWHGGNFHGDYVSFEMDKLKIAMSKLSMLAERQLNFLLNDRLNNILPPFLNSGVLGLNLGLQGLQFSATSTTAENQTLSFPMYLHSIPNNKDNQDVVSMGANSALICQKVINNCSQVLAILMIGICQSIQILDIETQLAPKTKAIYRLFNNSKIQDVEDRTFYKLIKEFQEVMSQNNLQENFNHE